jgi:MFS family permease
MSNNSRINTKNFQKLHTFDALRNSNYRLLWGTNISMYVSRWMQMTTLSWFVLDQTNSPFSVGLVGFFAMVPFLVLGIFGGFLADKLNRKKLIVVTQFLNLAAATVMSLLFIYGSVEYWYAYIAIIIPGLGWSLDMPSRRSLIMDMMGSKGITNGVALDSVGMHVSKMVGPALAGAMIAFVGVSGSYVMLTLFMTVGCLMITKVSQSKSRIDVAIDRDDRVRVSQIYANLTEGFKYAFTNQTISAVIVITILMNLLLFPYMQMVTVVSKEILNVGPLLMGVLMASDGLGALTGSIGIASQSRMKYHGRIYLYGSLLSLVALFLFSNSSWYFLSLPLLLFLGIGTSGFGTMQSTIVLLVSKAELRGRVLGVVTIAIGAGPIGSLIIGAISEWIGASYALMINSVIGFLLVAIAGLLMPSIREKIIPFVGAETVNQPTRSGLSTKV